MKTIFFIVFFSLVTLSFGQTRIPSVRIDTILFERKMPPEAKKQILNTLKSQLTTFDEIYGKLLYRCERCRGKVKLEFHSDSSGKIDSVQLVYASDRIIDRTFLDTVEDQIPREHASAEKKFTFKATLSFTSKKPSGSNANRAASGVIGALLGLLISLLIPMLMRGGM